MTAPRQSWTDVRDQIHGRILDATYARGQKLPRDEDLAEELGCARSTVQRAMQALADSGMVERKRRGGTTVCLHPVTRATLSIPITRREIEDRGQSYGHQLLVRRICPPPPALAASLGVAPGRAMLQINALHLADRRPYMLENRWVCLDTVPEIAAVDFTTLSANEWLVRNRPYSDGELRLSAHTCTQAEASMLGATQGQALLALDRSTWIDGAPITSVHAVMRPGYELICGI